MSPVVTEILQQIDRLSRIEQAQILQHLTQQTEKSTGESSKLDRFSEFLQAEGFYEDEYIQAYMTEIANK
jgi:hypothetical protein